MEKIPFFSIIIPVYNVEQYLRECLDAVLEQTYAGYEVICVNDGSTDGSLTILLDYKLRYDNFIVLDGVNGGTASARNKGIDAARGEYIWFVDSDDWIEKTALQILRENITENLDILSFNGKLLYEIDGREEEDAGFSENSLTGWEYYNKYALKRSKFHFVCVVLRLYRREFVLNHNLYFELGILHEDNLWIPLVFYYAKSVRVIPESVYYYRIRSGSKMQSENVKKMFDIVQVANLLSDFFIPVNNLQKQIVYREIAGEYFKGFMPEEIKKFGNHDNELKQLIHWTNYKSVSIYPRHKRIYFLLRIHPVLFRLYIISETRLKKIRS